MNEIIQPTWLKAKGYLHITPQLDTNAGAYEIISKISNKNFISKYAFFPLIHANIDERKFKKISSDNPIRAHSYKNEQGKFKKNTKIRPLHYASHFDSLIFGYYAEMLQCKYELLLKDHIGLGNCIIAYRKIPLENNNKNKSTIHFANEIFENIRSRSNDPKENCVVLTFDIKNFFPSLDHDLLKKAWANLLCEPKLPPDHFNVFRAATQFSYIYLDELRMGNTKKPNRNGFDEKELARIRNNHGVNAFFESSKAFRDDVKSGKVKLYKFPFRNKMTKVPIGIPQGLPISATLANLYLLKFDLKILDTIVKLKGYYRRYSDDIVIVCDSKSATEIEDLIISEMKANKVEISVNKTERFEFRWIKFGKKNERLTSVKITKNGEKVGAPFNYLGFEFNGQKALIKSANIAKFYRRMISSIKSKAKRAKLIAENTNSKSILFRRQLYKLYTTKPLHDVKIRNRWKKIISLETGKFRLISGVKNKTLRSNYLSYIQRASKIMNEPAIEKQLHKHKKIFNQAFQKHLKE